MDAVKALQQTFGPPDASLVSLPQGVDGCHVFRNVVSADDEQRIYEELALVLQRDGQAHSGLHGGMTERRVRYNAVELFGTEPFTEFTNWRSQDKKRAPGFAWSPTLVKWLARFAEGVFPRDATAPLSGDGAASPYIGVTSARVVEHLEAGDEMRVEKPAVGRCFLYLNLLAETVLTFDDEASEREGCVMLPIRSLMFCHGGVRWGWRFGERSLPEHCFTRVDEATGRPWSRRIDADYRLSVQAWQFTPGLVDMSRLREHVTTTLAANPDSAPRGEGALGGDLSGEEAPGARASSGPATAASLMQDYNTETNRLKKLVHTFEAAGKDQQEGRVTDWGDMLKDMGGTPDLNGSYGYDAGAYADTFDALQQRVGEYKEKMLLMRKKDHKPGAE